MGFVIFNKRIIDGAYFSAQVSALAAWFIYTCPDRLYFDEVAMVTIACISWAKVLLIKYIHVVLASKFGLAPARKKAAHPWESRPPMSILADMCKLGIQSRGAASP